MQDIDYDKLGEEIAKHLHNQCPLGLTAEDVSLWREGMQTLRELKRKAYGSITGAVVLMVLGLIALGFVGWLRELFST